MKTLYKLIIAIYFSVWMCIFYYLLGSYVHLQTITGNTVDDLIKIYLVSTGIYNWLSLFIPFVMLHSFVFVVVFLVNFVVERRVEQLKSKI